MHDAAMPSNFIFNKADIFVSSCLTPLCVSDCEEKGLIYHGHCNSNKSIGAYLWGARLILRNQVDTEG